MTGVIPTDEVEESTVRYERVVAFNIRQRLTAQHRSQRELADFMGLQTSAVSMKMTGKTTWSLADMVKAAAFLGVSLDDLTDDTIMVSMGAAPTKEELEKAIETDAREKARRAERRAAAATAGGDAAAPAIVTARAAEKKTADAPAGGPRFIVMPDGMPGTGTVPRMRFERTTPALGERCSIP
ncbi:peptidyl-prolyl cis-trans isomerase [Pseudoscardovia radai]|uniref:Peptidyl-prolyl cis-trans isomerase n=1 Tax=Pseudoscardovia radai TaxID=987066 RepID=A0A261EXQ1_9BIFI|nr:peptidyl-prolyl cis-trans isomerase [Pseudoscardovia radai]